ncbi:MAG: hypothetical protein Q9208_001337 [Pyrenodesmia sp. 3 TL-2023]
MNDTSKGTSSKFKDLTTFLSSVKGDFANITSPPFFLAPLSVTEIASCWTERPSVFVAATEESDPRKRALLIVKWILISLKQQYYIGRDVTAGIKKPLNAFLGERFIGRWTDEKATSRVLTEQVSHHPPITACYMWDNEHGIRGEGYTRVEMTFNGNINIKQFGHALVYIDRYDENYLIPMPDAKVKGFLSGHLYPELCGTYHIVSSTGFVTELNFSGKGFFSGQKNYFDAKMYCRDDDKKTAIYSIRGQWSEKFIITDHNNGETEKWDPHSCAKASLQIANEVDQDPRETRRAWKSTLEALRKGDMQATVKEKTKIEEAQRAKRREEASEGTTWTPTFFSQKEGPYTSFMNLASAVGWELQAEKTKGVWKVDRENVEKLST